MFGLRLARSRVRCTSKARRSWRAFFAPGFSTNAKRANDIAPVDCAEARAQPSGCWQWMMLLRTAVPLEAHQQHTPKLHTQHVAIHCLRGEPSWPTRSDAQTSGEREKLSPKLSPNYSQPVAIGGIATFSVAKKRTPSRIRAWGSCGLGGRGRRGDGVPPDPVTGN